MTDKPSYKKLEKIIEKLNAEIDVLKQSSNQLDFISNNIPDVIFKLDPNGIITYINNAVIKYGYLPEDLIGKSVYEIVHPDDIEKVKYRLNELRKGFRSIKDFHVRLLTQKREERAFEIRVGTEDEPFFNITSENLYSSDKPSPEKFIGIQGIARDVTERNNAEKELIFNEDIIRSSSSSIAACDLDGNMTFGNPAFITKWGFDDPKEFLGNRFTDYWLVNDRLDEIMRALLQGEGKWFGETRARRKDGTLFDVQVSAATVYDTKGNPFALTSTSTDITDLKQMEDALRKSEVRMRSIFRAAPIGIGLVSNRVFMDVNDMFCEITGYSRNEIIGKNSRMVYYTDEDYEYVGREKYSQIKEKGTGAVETRFKRKNGEIIDVLLSSTPLDPNDLSAGVTFTVLDITKRKEAEESLRESEEKYRLLIENIPSVTWITSEHGKTTFISPNVEWVYGFKAEKIYEKGDELWFKRIHPDDRKQVQESFIKMFDEGEKYDVEYRIKNKDGEWIWLHDTALRTHEIDNVRYAYGVFSEITERKQAEETLEEQTKTLNDILEKAADGICVCHNIPEEPYVKFTHWNPRMRGMTGYTIEEINRLGWYQSLYPDPELQQKAIERMAKMREGDDIHAEEWLITTKSDEKRTLSISTSVVKEEDGKVYVLAIIQDITDRKRAEEAIRENEKKYSDLIGSLQEGIWLIDKNAYTTFVNPPMAQMLGYTADEMQGKHLFDFMDEKDIEIASKKLENRRSGIKEQHEFEFRRKDGSSVFTLLETSSIIDKDGNYAGAIAGVIDITGRKQADRALYESEEKYRTILESIEEGYYETDIKGNFTFFNDSMCKISGYPSNELMRMNDRDFLTPETARNIYKIFNEIYRTEKPARIVAHELIKKDRSRINVEISASLIKDSKGKPAGFRGFVWDVTEAKKIEAELIKTKDFLQNIFNSSAECITTTDLHGNIIYVSPRMKDILGYDQKELIGEKAYSLYSNGKEDAEEIMKTITEKGELRNHEMKLVKKDGGLVDIKLSASLLKDEKGETIGTLGIYSDITEEKILDAQLKQAQKMEAIGTLAGGVAHDFNNILTTIIGNAELILLTVGKNVSLCEEIKEIKMAGERGAALTRQLLAFSRKQMIQPKILDLNKLLAGIKKMLVRLIGENIEILVIPEPGLWQVEIDPGQMEQVVMNLVVNARDAMPDGGKLTIQTANTYLDEDYFSEQNILEDQPGSYVMVAVSDTGSGMDKVTQEHIFEPFYSTKEKGKGTGLGLSTVYGIVKQNKGFIWVYSEPGQGTTFKIYLPSAREGVKTEEKVLASVKDLGGSETVLVVEDNVSLLNFAQKTLRKYGYNVLTANNGEDALRICKEHSGQIDLLLTDVVMPMMSGKQTVERLQPLYPQMKVIYMSGYTDDSIVHLGVLEPGLNFLEKPFSPEALAVKVREVLSK